MQCRERRRWGANRAVASVRECGGDGRASTITTLEHMHTYVDRVRTKRVGIQSIAQGW
jgi:hypothetical protein